jgi:hypothetical protein
MKKAEAQQDDEAHNDNKQKKERNTGKNQC